MLQETPGTPQPDAANAHATERVSGPHSAPESIAPSEILWLASAAGGVFVAVAAHLHRAALMPELREAKVIWPEYIFVMAAAMAMVALYAALGRRYRLGRALELPGLVVPLAVLLAVFVYRLGMYQFGGWDEGLVVHAATYYQHGFRPFVDFPCSMPPFFMAGIRFAALALGMKWSSFALMTAGYAAISFLWMYWLMLAAGLPRRWALLLSLAVELSTMFLVPFWWYNNTTSVAVVLLLLSVVACLPAEVSAARWASLAAALALVLTAKPNVALALPMVAVLFLVHGERRWQKVLLSSTVGVALAGAICYAAQLPPLKILRAYAEVGKLRGNPLAMMPLHDLKTPEKQFEIALISLVFALTTVAFYFAWRQRRVSRHLIAVCALAALTSLEMTATNAETKTTDLCVALVVIVLLAVGPELRAARRLAVIGVLSIFLAMSGYFGLLHLRILGIGEGMFYESLPTETIRVGFLNGLEASPRLLRVLQQSQDALATFPSQRVLFGPRLEVEYAVFQREPMRGIPLLWDTGILYSRDRIPELFNTFRELNPDLVILRKGDATGMDAVTIYLMYSETYQLVENYPEISVFVHRPNMPFQDADVRALMDECSRMPKCVKK